jgi:hypothetical protein
MTAIAAQFPDESVELDNVEEHRVLTTLEVIYEGGSLHGKIADFRTRDVERVVVGLHLLIGISLKLISARSASIFAASERSLATLALLTPNNQQFGGRGCSQCFAFAK